MLRFRPFRVVGAGGLECLGLDAGWDGLVLGWRYWVYGLVETWEIKVQVVLVDFCGEWMNRYIVVVCRSDCIYGYVFSLPAQIIEYTSGIYSPVLAQEESREINQQYITITNRYSAEILVLVPQFTSTQVPTTLPVLMSGGRGDVQLVNSTCRLIFNFGIVRFPKALVEGENWAIPRIPESQLLS